MTPEQIITTISALIALFLLIFTVDWHYFRDWIALFLYQGLLDFIWGSPVVSLKLIEYPVRLLPHYYETSILFELWILPVLCILYNQITRQRGIAAVIGYALAFSAGLTAAEYIIEINTNLIRYIDWSWFTSFYTLTIVFLLSRLFLAFFGWGCQRFDGRKVRGYR
ncbi:CBO0543 family protein [Acetonema longum]|uniref:Uncharacterized protein n=1 Tax=Acetonema longum DSM 6540 TaxID=1009370 RepID=F7NP83_9FIRM|nr:CBO0543 family protein [Acetonema longum]EGO62206.1 hypothetical protein ALO_19632 [Acetonema longum DSM 6540]